MLITAVAFGLLICAVGQMWYYREHGSLRDLGYARILSFGSTTLLVVLTLLIIWEIA